MRDNCQQDYFHVAFNRSQVKVVCISIFLDIGHLSDHRFKSIMHLRVKLMSCLSQIIRVSNDHGKIESICNKGLSSWWSCQTATWMDHRYASKSKWGGIYYSPIRRVFDIANNISHYRHNLIRGIIMS